MVVLYAYPFVVVVVVFKYKASAHCVVFKHFYTSKSSTSAFP